MSDLVKTGKEIGEIDYLWCMRQNNKKMEAGAATAHTNPNNPMITVGILKKCVTINYNKK